MTKERFNQKDSPYNLTNRIS